MEVFGYDLMVIVQVLIVVAGSYLFGKVAARMIARLFEKTPFPENIERSIVRASKYVTYMIGLLIIVAVVGFDVTSIIIGLGALSIAISFAMKDIIQNLVSGLLIQMDPPFRAGDMIKVQAFEGKVIKMSVRTTVLQAESGELVYIPNSIFATKPVINKTPKPSQS